MPFFFKNLRPFFTTCASILLPLFLLSTLAQAAITLNQNIQLGSGNPALTLNGDDLYVVGTLEVDGATQLDGTLTSTSITTSAQNIFSAVAGTTPLIARSTTATDDDLSLLPKTGGANRFTGIITTADLTSDKTYTFPNTTGTIALTANDLSSFASTTSSQLLTLLSDETGTGLSVFNTAPTFASTMSIGTQGGTTGKVNLNGTTSGTVGITTAATAGTWTLTLPANDGDASQVLQTDGAGVATWATSAGGTTILKRVSAAQAATVCATTDTNLTGGTYTLPANQLSTNKGIRITATFQLTTVGTADSLTFKLDFGGTDVLSRANATSRGYAGILSTSHNRDSASSQIHFVTYSANAAVVLNAAGYQSQFQTTSVNTTSAVTIAIQCLDADSGANNDDDTAALEYLLIEELGSGS